MRALKLLSPLLLLVPLAGCGGNSGSPTGTGGAGGNTATGGSGGTTSGTTITGDSFEFDTEQYSVKAGEEVNYLCFTTHVPSDAKLFITKVVPTYGKAIHHLGIYQTTTPEPDGTFNCPELVRDNWIPIYGGGVESGTLTMPEGAGLLVPEGGQILVQLHLQNTGSSDVTDKAHIAFETTKDAMVTRAGIFGFDNRDLKITAQTKDVMQEQTCAPIGRDMDVFAVFGHMHQRGKKIEVSRGAMPGQEVLYSATWQFQDQPTVPNVFHIAKEDTIHVRCWYDNPDSFDVGYGEKTQNEMCSFVFYYTPFTTLFGCLKLPK